MKNSIIIAVLLLFSSSLHGMSGLLDFFTTHNPLTPRRPRLQTGTLEHTNHFDRLPNELIDHIAGFIATGKNGYYDFYNFARTCRRVRTILTRALIENHIQLFKPVVIRPDQLNREEISSLENRHKYTTSITILNDSAYTDDYFEEVLFLGDRFPFVKELSFFLHKNNFNGPDSYLELAGRLAELTEAFPHLRSLTLKTDCGIIPVLAFEALPKGLTELSVRIDGDHIKDACYLLAGLRSLKNLRKLDLYGSKLMDDDLKALEQAPFVKSLEELNIGGSRFSAHALQSFLEKYKNLKVLKISSNRARSNTTNTYTNLLGDMLISALITSGVAEQLTTLDIHGNGIKLDYLPALFNNFKNLQNLDISRNLLSQATLQKLLESDFVKNLESFKHD